MGQTASNINWNPGDSTLGRTLTGQEGSAFKDPNIWNPAQSTLGQFAQGNYDNALNQTMGGIGNAVNVGNDLGKTLWNPIGAGLDLGNSIGGQTQARNRQKQDEQNQAADYAGVQRDQQAQEQARQQQAAAQKAQQDKLNSYNLQQQTASEADAFTQARNAARRAKGTTLFGAWG
jgi:hypothetical protein